MKSATNADVAFYNTGGIRTNFTIPNDQTKRNITIGDIYTMLPFNNPLLIYKLSAKQIINHITKSYVDNNYGDQVSGLTYEYKIINNNEIEVVNLMINNQVVDINDESPIYSICIPEYNATLQGSVFENIHPEVLDEQIIDNETIIKELQKQPYNLITVDNSYRTKKIN
jgi:2',3'-cyclic-nucleotide 2'-phosphodiesterase (5'-nucleotidase family)